jgi:hypothetical protein
MRSRHRVHVAVQCPQVESVELEGNMKVKNLAKTFEETPAYAFLSVLEDAGKPVRTVAIKKAIVDSGVVKSKVDTAWDSFKKRILDHPHIMRSGTAAYVWNSQPVTPSVALQRVSTYTGRRICPTWLSKALIDTIDNSLEGDVDRSAYVDDTEPLVANRLSDATVLAKVAGQIAEMAHAGADTEAILKWCDRQAAESGLDEIGRIGQQVPFDASIHSAAVGFPKSGDRVEVVRPGYRWTGGDAPILVTRAIVRPGL